MTARLPTNITARLPTATVSFSDCDGGVSENIHVLGITNFLGLTGSLAYS
jgi:hypothetical protein